MTAVQHRPDQVGAGQQGAPVVPEPRATRFLRDELRRQLSLARLARLASWLFKLAPATMCY